MYVSNPIERMREAFEGVAEWLGSLIFPTELTEEEREYIECQDEEWRKSTDYERRVSEDDKTANRSWRALLRG
jgi:hypothetical protein